MPQPKKRLPRIERDEVIRVGEDENQHLWAVSYSDFLMVLLSFFILFFSAETPQKQQMILELANHFTSSPTTAAASGSQRMPSGILESLKDMNITVDQEKESLVVNFPNNLYSPGQHQIDRGMIPLIKNFLSILKPYRDRVNLYFEGHADNSPLKVHKNNIVVDNFVLSSLRASSALGYAREMGFSDKTMFIQAAASNLRNSRSLSIRIEPRGEAL